MPKLEGKKAHYLGPIIINVYLFAVFAFFVLCACGWVYGLYVSLKAGNLALAVVGFIVLASRHCKWLGSILRLLVGASEATDRTLPLLIRYAAATEGQHR
jgi:uncharacterized oligopeptide transporter (OPT) family protein